MWEKKVNSMNMNFPSHLLPDSFPTYTARVAGVYLPSAPFANKSKSVLVNLPQRWVLSRGARWFCAQGDVVAYMH